MATYDEFVNRLSQLTGLNKDVLNVWASRENGVNNNILGVTSGGSLVKYPSQTAAAEATARLIQSSPNYAGIRTAESGTSQQQALAIAQSPWRLGGTGIKLAGGTDPWYYKGFVEAGILAGNTSKPAGGVSTPTMPTSNPTEDTFRKAAENTTSEIQNAPLKVDIPDIPGALMFVAVVLIGLTFLILGGIIGLRSK